MRASGVPRQMAFGGGPEVQSAGQSSVGFRRGKVMSRRRNPNLAILQTPALSTIFNFTLS